MIRSIAWVPKTGPKVAAQDRAVVGDRRRFALEDVLDVTEVALADLPDREALVGGRRDTDFLHEAPKGRLGLLSGQALARARSADGAELSHYLALTRPPLAVVGAAS